MNFKGIFIFFICMVSINCGSSLNDGVQVELSKCECSENYALISTKDKMLKENVNDLTLFLEQRHNLKYAWLDNSTIQVKLLAGLDWNYQYTAKAELRSDSIDLILVGKLKEHKNSFFSQVDNCTHYVEFNINVKTPKEYIVSLDGIKFQEDVFQK